MGMPEHGMTCKMPLQHFYIHQVNGVNWRIYCFTLFSVRPSIRPSVCEHSEAIGKRGKVWTQDLCMWGDRDNHYTTEVVYVMVFTRSSMHAQRRASRKKTILFFAKLKTCTVSVCIFCSVCCSGYIEELQISVVVICQMVPLHVR